MYSGIPNRSASAEIMVPADTKNMVSRRLRGPAGISVISLRGMNRHITAIPASEPAIMIMNMTFCFI